MTTRSILVVDDNQDLARGVGLVLAEVGDTRVVHSAEDALAALAERGADLVVSDVRMPGLDGLGLLEHIRRTSPRTRVVLFTAYGTIDAAVAAVKQGAYHYLTKPVDDEELLLVARRALGELDAEDELTRLRADAIGSRGFHGLYTRDPRMRPVIDAIRRVAPSTATVLILGESGTGKERVAAAIHAESPRARGPFVAFNAAAVPESLAESELFGCKRGAFTGADRDRKGLFVEASGGTLFIDEVQSTPLALQGKLLRALEAREVLPVGAATAVPVDVRIVAACNDDPGKLVREGRLRKDLYYRLSVVRVALPPLRERVEDIPLLASLFLARRGDPARRLTPAALRLLVSHDWPGNVRELQNVIERAALMSSDAELGPGAILLEDDLLGPSSGDDEQLGYEEAKRRAMASFQRRYVERALADSHGNLSAAARTVGITRAALHRIVKKLGLHAIDDEETARS
jgi:DNA-binding NtrC family response regulator